MAQVSEFFPRQPYNRANATLCMTKDKCCNITDIIFMSYVHCIRMSPLLPSRSARRRTSPRTRTCTGRASRRRPRRPYSRCWVSEWVSEWSCTLSWRSEGLLYRVTQMDWLDMTKVWRVLLSLVTLYATRVGLLRSCGLWLTLTDWKRGSVCKTNLKA